MELEKIKELIDMMKTNDLSELEIVDGQTRIMLKRSTGEPTVSQVVAMPSVVSAPASVAKTSATGARSRRAYMSAAYASMVALGSGAKPTPGAGNVSLVDRVSIEGERPS